MSSRSQSKAGTATSRSFTSVQEVLESKAHISICAVYDPATSRYGVDVITSEDYNPLDGKSGYQGQTLVCGLHLMSKQKDQTRHLTTSYSDEKRLRYWTQEVQRECQKHEPYLTNVRASLVRDKVCQALRKDRGWHHPLGETPTVDGKPLLSRVWSFPGYTAR
jgi:hypothetical protein